MQRKDKWNVTCTLRFCVMFHEPYPQMSTEAQMTIEAVYSLQLIGFSTGCTGCFFSLITLKHTDWRLWIIEKTSHYRPGITRVGIWKICFPPNLKEPDNYTLVCCHDFAFYEKFFPVEMKLGQILMFTGSFLAFWGLLFAFFLPWNTFYRRHIQTRWLPFIGGIFYVVSSICVFVPISWNVYSVLRNESIPFPSSFHLPSRPITQRNGGAIYLGIMSGVLLFMSGFCVIFQVILMRTIGIRAIRIIPV